MKTRYRIFVKGLITLLPISLTLYIVYWMANKADSLFSGLLSSVFGIHIPGLGLVMTIGLIMAFGLMVDAIIAKPILSWVESQFLRVPFIKAIYRPLKDIMNLFSTDQKKEIKRVVFLKFDNLPCKVLGLVTRELPPPDDQWVAVYVPLSYAIGGITVIAPKANLQEVDLPVEQAMKLALTAWVKT